MQSRPNILNIKSFYLEAWQLTSGLKWPIFKRMFLFVITIIPLLVFFIIFFAQQPTQSSTLNAIISFVVIDMILGVISLKIWIPAIMLGVRQAVGMAIDIKAVKADCEKVKDPLFNLVILYVFITSLFLQLDIFLDLNTTLGLTISKLFECVVFLFAQPINFFAIPYLITRKSTVGQAFDSACQKGLLYWQAILYICLPFILAPLPLYFLLFYVSYHFSTAKFIVLMVLVVIAMVSAIWLVPMYYALGGVLFREVYGLKSKRV